MVFLIPLHIIRIQYAIANKAIVLHYFYDVIMLILLSDFAHVFGRQRGETHILYSLIVFGLNQI